MKAAALALVLILPALPVAAQTVPAACPATANHLSVNGGLDRSRGAVARGSVRILAVGSSSIEGVGASRRELGFVPLLERGLRERLPGVEVTVVNRGIGGETAKDTADRLAREVEAAPGHLLKPQVHPSPQGAKKAHTNFNHQNKHFSNFRVVQDVLTFQRFTYLLLTF